MTLKELDKLARARMPVMHEGYRYDRITFVGIAYDAQGIPHETVTIVRGNSQTRVNPDRVQGLDLNTGKYEK